MAKPHVLGVVRNGYVVIDCETTGLSTQTDRVIEIGAQRVVRRGGRLRAEPTKSILVDPDVPIPWHITQITGIKQKAVDRKGVSTADAIRWLVDRTSGLPIVGHNLVRFDYPLLVAERKRSGFRGPRIRQGDMIDTAALFKGWRLGEVPRKGESLRKYSKRVLRAYAPGVKYNLSYACAEMGVDCTEVQTHRAAGDVLLTRRLFLAMLDVVS